MGSETTGAASAAPLATVSRDGATPALADQWEAEAIDAIAGVQDPDEAEQLLGRVTLAADAMRIARLGEDRKRRWDALRVKAERRWGELLGPADRGKRGSVSATNTQRQAQHQARKVAAVPQEDFDDYVDTAPKPTRKGVLDHRKTRKNPAKERQLTDAGENLWEDERVVAWIAKRVRAQATRDGMIADAKAGKHDWPLPGRRLTQATVDRATAIIKDRKRRGDTVRRRQPSESGRRLRQLHAEKRAGRADGLWELQVAIAHAVSGLEMFRLPELDWSENTEALVMDLFDDLERHARWSEAALEVVAAHIGELGRQRKIRMLEVRANDPSSTEHERASAASRIEVLKRKRKHLPSAS